MTLHLARQRCTIREWQAGDAVSLQQHADDPRIARNLRDRFPSPYSMADAERWLVHAATVEPATNFAITVGDSAVGGIGLEIDEDVFRRSAEVGYWLGTRYWGQGIMSEALGAFTEWAFANFDVCRLYAGVFDWNPGSAKVLQKCGYVLEGRLRKAVTKNGHTLDELLYARVT